MFGVTGKTPTRPIDSFIEGDERVLWVDRFNPTRPRMRPVARWPYIRRNAYGTLCLVFVAVCAVWLAIDPTFFRQMIPELKHHQLIMTVIALIAVSFAIAAVVQDWTMLRHGERMEFDYVLTDERLLALHRSENTPEIFELARVTGFRLEGSGLTVGLQSPDQIVRLVGLTDPTGALSVFQRTLREFRSRAD